MLLAIDTSTRFCGIALYDGVQVLAETIWSSHDFHTVELAPAIAEMLRRTGLQPEKIQAIAVATGPGSFTGLRIGLAVAKGIALARRVPLIGVASLDVLASAQPVVREVLMAVLQAGRSRLAVGKYRPEAGHWQADGPAVVMDAETLASGILQPSQVCGELDEETRRLLARKRKNVLLASPARSLRRPSFLAELAWRRWRSGYTDDPTTLSPIYLHTGEPIPDGGAQPT